MVMTDHDVHPHTLFLYLDSMQNDPVVSQASELLRLGLMPTPQEIRDGKVRSSFCVVVFIKTMWGP